MDDQCRPGTAPQVCRGQLVRGGDEFRRPVGTHLQCGQFTAGGIAGVVRLLEHAAGGLEISALTLAHRVDLEPMEAGCQDLVGIRIYRHRHVAVCEIESGGGDLATVSRLQGCGHPLGAGCLGGRRCGLATALLVSACGYWCGGHGNCRDRDGYAHFHERYLPVRRESKPGQSRRPASNPAEANFSPARNSSSRIGSSDSM